MNGWALLQRSSAPERAARHGAARDPAVSGSATSPVSERICGSCRYFCQAPHEIESQMPGLRSLGSVFGSVRASDGLCRRHDRYLGASSHCGDYEGPV
jgi:hypothetical protein